jgi:hypothetical protein
MDHCRFDEPLLLLTQLDGGLIIDSLTLDELGGILLALGAVVFRTKHPARGGKKQPPQALAELTLNESS